MTASTYAELDAAIAAPKPRIAAELLAYFGCSAVALATDFGLFSAGLWLGAGYPVVAAVGFVAGLWVAYRLSVRFAFRHRSVANERLEFMLFAAVGLAGLLLTEGLLWLLVERAAVGPSPARLATAGMVFCFNFVARKALLFTRRAPALPA